MRFETRPLPATWPAGQRTPHQERRWGGFKATLAATMELLEAELRHLEAREPIVIEAGYRPHEIRLDGKPRSGARPSDPAVIISFESRLGPLRYASDAYATHERNLRAIALTLEHLRAVDRYGVTKRGEQYQGWLALPPAADSVAEAERIIRRLAGGKAGGPVREAYMAAARRLHPDVGGDPEDWAELNRAWQVVRSLAEVAL